MGLTGARTYVGFGFGAIQAGLLLYEAYRSGNFGRLVVVEVLPSVVASLRQAEGYYRLNIAHSDRVESVRIGPIEIYDPSVATDRERLVDVLVSAQEIGTAIPSVAYYQSVGLGSLHRLLAEGLRRKAAGTTTSLDMALPDPSSPAGRADWGAILRSVLPYVDVFLPSIEEILFMLRPATYQTLRAEAGGPDILPLIRPSLLSDLSWELMALGAGIVALKLGDRGLYLRTASQARLAALGRARPSDLASWADKELWAPCFQVDVVGTTGSGDATISGFLSALLRNLPPEQAVTAAVAVGACNVEAADALSGICTWDETWQRVRSGWARHELPLDAPGWSFDDEYQLWVGRREGENRGGVPEPAYR